MKISRFTVYSSTQYLQIHNVAKWYEVVLSQNYYCEARHKHTNTHTHTHTHTQTHMHTHTHTYELLGQKHFKKPGTHQHVAGNLVATLHRIVKLAINVMCVLLECFSETLLLCHIKVAGSIIKHIKCY